MEEPQATPALQEFPQLQRLAMFSPATQGLIADYLAYLNARHYTPSVQEGTIRALKSFAVLMPAARQAVLYQDLTQTTPTDIDAWIEASFRHQLAPGTVATRLRVVQGLFRFLRDSRNSQREQDQPGEIPRHRCLRNRCYSSAVAGSAASSLPPGSFWAGVPVARILVRSSSTTVGFSSR